MDRQITPQEKQALIDDPDLRRIQLSVQELGNNLARRSFGCDLTTSKYEELRGIVADHVTRARLSGIRFPDVVLVALQSAKGSYVQVVRQDLDEEGVQNLIMSLGHAAPHAKAVEIAKAVRRAFPDYGRNGGGAIVVRPRKFHS